MSVQKPVLHGRDHLHGGPDPSRIAFEDVGDSGGGGGGIQFDVTPQSGTFLDLRTTGHQSPTTNGIQMQATEAINIFGETGLALNGNDPGGVFMHAAGTYPTALTLALTSTSLYLQDNTGAFLLLIEKVGGIWRYRMKSGASWVADL